MKEEIKIKLEIINIDKLKSQRKSERKRMKPVRLG